MKTAKATRTPKPKLKKKASRATMKKKPAAKVKMAVAARKPKSTLGIVHPKGGDSDRGLYVRFGTEKDGLGPAIKARVKAMADKCGVAMNAYIVAATLDWVEQGKTLSAAAKEELATGT